MKLAEKVQEGYQDRGEIDTLLHQTIKKVGDDIEAFKFNTAISALMILLNAVEKEEGVSVSLYERFTQLIAPFAPHCAEELWRGELQHMESVHTVSWPDFDPSKLLSGEVTLAIQVAGKLRGTIEAPRDAVEELVIDLVKKSPIYQKYIENKEPKKIIVVKNKIVNIVI
jgi:leucyl-tRNA synthetase